MNFINMAKERVLRDMLWLPLNKKIVPLKYISIIKDMDKRVAMNIKTCGRLMDEFLITIGVHRRLTLSHFFFAIVIDEITKTL